MKDCTKFIMLKTQEMYSKSTFFTSFRLFKVSHLIWRKEILVRTVFLKEGSIVGVLEF